MAEGASDNSYGICSRSIDNHAQYRKNPILALIVRTEKKARDKYENDLFSSPRHNDVES